MCLDASAFPHVLDAIIDASSPASLIALRPVSQELCERADALLFAHIVVTSAPTRAPSFLSGPAQIILTTPCGHRLPAPPLPSLTAACASLNSTLRPLLRNTRAVTLRSMTLATANTLAPLLPRLDVVHRHTPQPWDSPLLKAATYVDHVNLSRPAISGCMPLGDVPSDLAALVLRFAFHTAHYPPHFEHPPFPGGGVPEALPVLEDMDPPHIPAITVVADPTGPKWASSAGWTGTIARRLGRARPHALTLVAFDELGAVIPPATNEHEGCGDGMDAATRAVLIEHAQWGLNRARVVVPQLAVLSRAEWAAGTDLLTQ